MEIKVRRAKLTPKQREERNLKLMKDYNKGLKIRELKEKYGLSHQSINVIKNSFLSANPVSEIPEQY